MSSLFVPNSSHLTFPAYIASGHKSIRAILEEAPADLCSNALKGAVKERVNLHDRCVVSARNHLRFMQMIANSDLEDPKAVESAFLQLSSAQIYVDSVFGAFRDRLHILRRRVLASNWKLRDRLHDAVVLTLGSQMTVDALKEELKVAYWKAIHATAPTFGARLSTVKGFKDEFSKNVSVWCKAEKDAINRQIAEL